MDDNDIKTIAPLKNVHNAHEAMKRAIARPAHLPGIVALYGPSGWGKSKAAAYCANKTKSYYVECKSAWSRKSFLGAILKQMGISPDETLASMLDQIAEQLVLSRRPLILDEFDYMVQRREVELVRDIYDSSFAPILIIGEEGLPSKLKKTERFHRRVMYWVQAQPASIEDAGYITRLYAPGLKVEPDLMKHIVSIAKGSIGRVCINIEQARDEAVNQGLDSIGMAQWGKREFYTGEAPERG